MAMQKCNLVAAMAILPLVGGCGVGGGVQVPPVFSPDGKRVAYVWSDGVAGGIPWTMMICGGMEQTVRWFNIDQPSDIRGVDTHGEVVMPFCPPNMITDLAFSSDSQRLMVSTLRGIDVIDLAAGQKRQVHWGGDGYVSSVAWLDGDEIAYVTHDWLRVGGEFRWQRRIWRQRLDQPPAGRRLIYQGPGTDIVWHGPAYSYSTDWEHWSQAALGCVFSPSLASPDAAPEVLFVDIDGKATDFTEHLGKLFKAYAIVGWSTDGARLIVVTEVTRKEDNLYFVDIHSWSASSCSPGQVPRHGLQKDEAVSPDGRLRITAGKDKAEVEEVSPMPRGDVKPR